MINANPKAIGGKAIMGTVTDMEPLLRSMLLEMKRQAGQTDDVTADELSAAARAFGEDVDANSADAVDEVMETMQRSLPSGVRIEKIDARREGTRVTSTTTFAFDDIRALPQLEVFFERGARSQRPFASLKLEDVAGALVVDGMPPAMATPGPDAPEAELKKNAVMLALEVALPVAEHNATRAETVGGAQRLTWEIDALRLRGRKGDDAGWIHVKYKI